MPKTWDLSVVTALIHFITQIYVLVFLALCFLLYTDSFYVFLADKLSFVGIFSNLEMELLIFYTLSKIFC